MAETEAILGEIPVAAQLTVGSERLSLFFTSDRLIVARVGKRGTSSMAALPLFSALTGGLEGLLRLRKDTQRRKAAEQSLTPAGILAADKENFPVRYEEIVSVELVLDPEGRSKMTIVTRDDKLLFSTGASFEKLLALLRGRLSGGRLMVRRSST